MEKLLWLLFTPLLIGQIDVVNTTTQLSAHEGTGIIILNTPDSYGGIYTYIDSTYSEGTFAFAHPYTGKQWARLGAFANATFTTLTGSNAETIVNTTDGQFSFGDANLLTTGTLGAGATTLTTITGTGTAILKTGTGGSSSDSSLVFTSAAGAPLLTWYGTDGDAVAIGINTSDAMLFTGAVGGYSFSGEMAVSDALTISTNGVKQFKLFDTDADDAQQPYWYLQNANNGSKGIFYLGYTNVSNNTSTDVMLVDSVSFTLGSVIGTGTKDLYAGTITSAGAISGTTGSLTSTLTAPSVSLTSYSTITNQNATNAADSDTLALGSDVSNLIKVRSSTSASDSVVYLTGGVANSYYQFKAVHTDTTITFADAINANLILGASRVLDGDDDLLILFYDGTKWIEVAFSNNE